tara:strand:+ start:1034 stop:1333 length:300 start_codon:yes stop_codon:yes gene_type:complete
MRKITEESINAFNNAKPFSRGNTQVKVFSNVTVLNLHSNPIAFRYNDPERTLSISTCGWSSNTTKERLNGLEEVNIFQKDFEWYLNDEKWDGKLIDIKN